VNATGDGPAAGGLVRPPADLTAPHVGDHTAGDMFGWISNGMAPGGMPGFADQLAEDQRWDLVNFVHALSIGHRARILRETIVPRAPWVTAPGFAFVTPSGVEVALQDYRERALVLLVLFALPDSRPRLSALRQSAQLLTAAGVTVIAVPIDSTSDAADPAIIPGVTPATHAGNDIVDAYMLFRGTLTNRRIAEAAARPRHLEFLIDRYGFLRARWVPEDGTPGWGNIDTLIEQVRALSTEGRVRAPPDEHLH
jgi:putative copper resistance protein D